MKRLSLGIGLALAALANSTASAQDTAASVPIEVKPDPKLRELRDSVEMLLRERRRLQEQIADNALTNADILRSPRVIPSDDHVHFEIGLNRIGRVRVTVTGAGGAFRKEYMTPEFKTEHLVMVSGLAPNTQYFIDVDIIGNSRTAGPTGVRLQSSDPKSKNHEPQLAFTTTAAIVPPALSVEAPKVATTSATFSSSTLSPALFQVRIFSVLGEQRETSREAIQVVGDDLGTEKTGTPTVKPARSSAGLQVAALEANTTYRYVVFAMNTQGKVTESPMREFKTLAKPTPLAFVSPLHIRVDPTKGLVVRWRSSVVPSDAVIQAVFPKAGGIDSTTFSSSTKPASEAVEVTLSNSELLTAALANGQVPVLRVSMVAATGERTESSFSVAIELSRPSIASVANRELRESLEKVYGAASGRETKLTWRDLASASLKVLTAVVVP